ncbi:hypothetical protein Tco_0778211 [Tanacetum coccineum]
MGTHRRHSWKSECLKADQDSRINPHGTRFDGLSCKSQGRKDADNKRKWENEQGGNPYQQQTKRRKVVPYPAHDVTAEKASPPSQKTFGPQLRLRRYELENKEHTLGSTPETL